MSERPTPPTHPTKPSSDAETASPDDLRAAADDPTSAKRNTGEQQAAENQEVDPPA